MGVGASGSGTEGQAAGTRGAKVGTGDEESSPAAAPV